LVLVVQAIQPTGSGCPSHSTYCFWCSGSDSLRHSTYWPRFWF
jgi:hypothetical protein